MKNFRRSILILTCLSIVLISSCTRMDGRLKTCPQVKESYEPTVFYVGFDISGSAKTFRPLYIAEFTKIVDSLNPGDVIVADVISDNSLISNKFAINFQLSSYPENNSSKGSFKQQQQTFKQACSEFEARSNEEIDKIKQTGRDFLTNVKIASPKTQILDAIFASTRVFESYPDHQRKLLIFSDGVEDSELAVFDKKLPDESLIGVLRQKQRLPNLAKAKVFFIGASVSNKIVKDTSTDYLAIKNFWMQYFKAANADLSDENYGTKTVALKFDEPKSKETEDSEQLTVFIAVRKFFGLSAN